jgi:hypothetical protein
MALAGRYGTPLTWIPRIEGSSKTMRRLMCGKAVGGVAPAQTGRAARETQVLKALSTIPAEIWGSTLELGGNLAGGADRCDFRWLPMELAD